MARKERRERATYALDGEVAGVAFSGYGEELVVGYAKPDLVSRLSVMNRPGSPLVLRAEGEDIPSRHPWDSRPSTWEAEVTPDGSRIVVHFAGRAIQARDRTGGLRTGHVEASELNEELGRLLPAKGETVLSGAGKVAHRGGWARPR